MSATLSRPGSTTESKPTKAKLLVEWDKSHVGRREINYGKHQTGNMRLTVGPGRVLDVLKFEEVLGNWQLEMRKAGQSATYRVTKIKNEKGEVVNARAVVTAPSDGIYALQRSGLNGQNEGQRVIQIYGRPVRMVGGRVGTAIIGAIRRVTGLVPNG